MRTARFLRHFLRPDPAALRIEEVSVPLGSEQTAASLYLPNADDAVPGWVVLHGITAAGRTHASLHRFAAALCASGAAVLVPEIPSWTALRVNPAAAGAAIRGGAEALSRRSEVLPGGVSVVGFSFGATQALVAAGTPETAGHLRSVVGFGGYCELRRITTCMLTGEHEWAGKRFRLNPDPYGRWILGANYLPRAAGYEGLGRVAGALHALALEAGRRGVPAASAEYDAFKAELRAGLDAAEREVWDLFAPPAGPLPPGTEAVRLLARSLADAAVATDPLLDPLPFLPRIDKRVVLMHGLGDPLIPFTETLRLRHRLPRRAEVRATITRLFAHSGTTGGVHPLQLAPEAWRFVRVLSRALRPS